MCMQLHGLISYVHLVLRMMWQPRPDVYLLVILWEFPNLMIHESGEL